MHCKKNVESAKNNLFYIVSVGLSGKALVRQIDLQNRVPCTHRAHVARIERKNVQLKGPIIT